MTGMRLTELSHGGGCGCKIAPALLAQMLATMPVAGAHANLLVGTETSDDAAVYRLNDEQALIATTDFFMPIVDDPYDFGRIAATNAISDVYAMGGKPILALAIVGMPINLLPVETIQRILAGGASVCAEAGIPVAGGHSIDAPEPIYGLVALGLVHPDHVKRNNTARAGDVLILGKPLGIGVLGSALKQNLLDAQGYAQLLATTTQLNSVGPELARLDSVHALTDVTGFRPARTPARSVPRGAAERAPRCRPTTADRRRCAAGAAGRRAWRHCAQSRELRRRRALRRGCVRLAAASDGRRPNQRRLAGRGRARRPRRTCWRAFMPRVSRRRASSAAYKPGRPASPWLRTRA